MLLAIVLALPSSPGWAAGGFRPGAAGGFRPGAAGAGDPYFPLDGNGGYDVRHYLLDIDYRPDTDVLTGTAVITARATQDLSSFHLDLDGLTVRAVEIDGRAAGWRRRGGELIVTPRQGLRRGAGFRTVVRYDGVPRSLEEPGLGPSGVLPTDDGMVIIGQPHVAATWFPADDHPSDKATYTVRATVPDGLTAVSNGVLAGWTTRAGRTTWTWENAQPMASYLATATVGRFDLREYRVAGIRYWDAIDSRLFTAPAVPRTGRRMAMTQEGASAYRRLSRTVDVPATGAVVDFWTTRDTEPNWDYFLVEARPAGTREWTTLPDTNGHTTSDAGAACAYAPTVHPFLLHYVTPGEDFACAPTGTSGTWSAASGASDGYEHWSIDLGRYAGRQVEIALTYVSDPVVVRPGVFLDDIDVSTGEGSTSFEDDDDPLDGWVAAAPPEGSPADTHRWMAGTADQLPPTPGARAAETLARGPEIIDFLAGLFGPYPFTAAGGLVDDTATVGFALENQTRPIYPLGFFGSPRGPARLMVHELAHQWFGDSVTLGRWRDIWLNEGFATYAEWLWVEHEGYGTVRETFDAYYAEPADSVFWELRIDDPGPAQLFAPPVYTRGAMTLHRLRSTVGDRTFFQILRTWASAHAGDTVTTPEFVALAERLSGLDLDPLFAAWLSTASKPQR